MKNLLNLGVVIALLLVLPTLYGGSSLQSTPSVDIKTAKPTKDQVLSLRDNVVMPSVKVITNRGRGSGVLVNEHFVLTAAHVVYNAETIAIEVQPFEDLLEVELYEFGNLMHRDYAVLKLQQSLVRRDSSLLGLAESREVPLEHFAQPILQDEWSTLRTTEEVISIAYPLGGPIHMTRGQLGVTVDGFIRSSADIVFGCSGSGLFTDDYRLIGIASRGAIVRGQMITWIGYFVTMDEIYQDLASKDKLYVITGDLPEESLPESTRSFDSIPDFFTNTLSMSDGFEAIILFD